MQNLDPCCEKKNVIILILVIFLNFLWKLFIKSDHSHYVRDNSNPS